MDSFGLKFLQPRLRLLMLGQIAHKSREVGFSARSHFADRKVHRERGSVPAPAGYDTADSDDVSLAGGTIARQISVVARLVRHRHQLADVQADGFVFGIAEHSFG